MTSKTHDEWRKERDGLQSRVAEQADRIRALEDALRGVIRVADRKTDEFDAAREALGNKESKMNEAPLPLVDAYARRIAELHAVLRVIERPVPNMDTWDAPRLVNEIRAIEAMAREALPPEVLTVPETKGESGG